MHGDISTQTKAASAVSCTRVVPAVSSGYDPFICPVPSVLSPPPSYLT